MENIDNRELAINYIEKRLNSLSFQKRNRKLVQAIKMLLSEIERTPEIETIKAKMKLNLPLNERERSLYLLKISDKKERKEFLRKERENVKKDM